MITKNKKTKKESGHNLFFSILLGVLIFVVIGSLIVANWRINQKRDAYESQVGALQIELQALEIKREQLQSQIYQTSEEEYLEKEARETFNLKKSGEEVVAILPAEEEGGGESETGFFEKIWDKIKFW